MPFRTGWSGLDEYVNATFRNSIEPTTLVGFSAEVEVLSIVGFVSMSVRRRSKAAMAPPKRGSMGAT
jgi:hypothetical protein